MRLASIKYNAHEVAALVVETGVVPLPVINAQWKTDWKTDILEILQSGQLPALRTWYEENGKTEIEGESELVIPATQVQFGPLYLHPPKIWGIGLNYVDHATDLSEKAPSTIPASFMKADTTIIGPGDEVLIPAQSEKTTGEAELGIIIGKRCKEVPREKWLDVVAGFTAIIDMTAEDILRQNPRYLTVSKNFDTFFSFGPVLVTPDEITDISTLEVATVINGTVHAKNVISNMTFPPDFLVSFHSYVYTMLPGDIISTGTPRATPLADGDQIECQITGFRSLVNPVRDLKRQ